MKEDLNANTMLRDSVLVSEAKHIAFYHVGNSQTGKTKIFWVLNKEKQSYIGQINWYSSWYQYSFFPQDNCVFEKQCLRDIADFCEEQTKTHRTSNKPKEMERKKR